MDHSAKLTYCYFGKLCVSHALCFNSVCSIVILAVFAFDMCLNSNHEKLYDYKIGVMHLFTHQRTKINLDEFTSDIILYFQLVHRRCNFSRFKYATNVIHAILISSNDDETR